MSGGLNQDFKDDPLAFFMKYNVYGFNLVGGGAPPQPFPGSVTTRQHVWNVGKCTETFDFRLDTNPQAGGRRVIMYSWAERLANSRREHFGSAKIDAYYLPQNDGWATLLTVRSVGPSYFFTTQLSGCRVVVNGAANPTIVHIAASGLPRETNQDSLELAALGATQVKCRFYDRSIPPDANLQGFAAGYDNTGFVFGYRMGQGAAWRMYAQNHGKISDGNDTLQVQELPSLVRLL